MVSVKDKAEYLVMFVNEFAKRYQLTDIQAYRYLKRFKAIDFLEKEYNVAHTQSFDDMVDAMNECTARDLIVMLSEEYQIAPSEAMDILYNSETYAKLKDPKTGLYFQSPAYIYGYLDKEMKQGSLATE